jgi:hypothetical protein
MKISVTALASVLREAEAAHADFETQYKLEHRKAMPEIEWSEYYANWMLKNTFLGEVKDA